MVTGRFKYPAARTSSALALLFGLVVCLVFVLAARIHRFRSDTLEEVLAVDVAVLGGGAAGLMCAMTAAARGRTVVVLERSNKLGKKILMSGGGRCNFTNLVTEPEHYLSKNAYFCISALRRYPPSSFIDLVERHNIAFEERKHGQLFCLESASDILDMLMLECRGHGVSLRTRTEPLSLNYQDDQQTDEIGHYELVCESPEGTLKVKADSVVVATGALSIPTLGGSDQGYQLAEQFGLALVPRHPGLVPFMATGQLKGFCEQLSGVSLPVTASCNGQSFTEDLLFTHRGLSGPAILQISNYWSPGDALILDLLPEQSASDLLVRSKRSQPSQTLLACLSTHLPRSFVTLFLGEEVEIDPGRRLADIRDSDLVSLGTQLNQWRLKPAATEGYRTAEVTLGGVSTAGLNGKTLEARHQPGLFFVGEVVDVSGHLGGFNFQWAWASGFCAGEVV